VAVRNITRGGGAANKPIVDQLKDLEAQLKSLRDDAPLRLAQEVIRDTARDVYQAVVASAAAANIPHEAMQDIFYYAKPNPGDKQISAVVGLRKKGRGTPYAHGYVEWVAGMQIGKHAKYERSKTKKKRKGLVSGRKIGESLATMWELGTTKHAARPFFRTAIQSARAGIITSISGGFKKIIDEYGT
jgi:hypothetical protein